MSLLLQAVLVVIKDPRFVPFYAHFIFAVVAARGCRRHRPTDSLPYTKMLLDDLLEKKLFLDSLGLFKIQSRPRFCFFRTRFH